jgi:hypothetical protein
MLLLKFKRQEFVRIFCCCKTVLNIVWTRNRSRNQNFFKVRTGTTTNRYGSITLTLVTLVYIEENVGVPVPSNHKKVKIRACN